ncbi:hypothetical protein HOLleu_06496 [Holothuria leucospilota]|uniref:Uncharacterized protein n=1 Tax=Holothuria leucospilota TaxID=206669 RepID=A0A9Q1CM73_HOLLE|nr:hypothetical protein HOLleu_06496 [Holothuria leucospilota]
MEIRPPPLRGGDDQILRAESHTQPQAVMTGKENKEKYVVTRTVTVVVKNEKRNLKVEINVLLDDASTSTFISSDVAWELGLKGRFLKRKPHF